MNYLLDTNIISELARLKPNTQVEKWISTIPSSHLFLSVLTIGEIRKGIEKVADMQKKYKLLNWLEIELTALFTQRILPITIDIADRWGRLQAQSQRTLPSIDALIAATALHHDMMLVSRNTADFIGCEGLQIMNPFEILT